MNRRWICTDIWMDIFSHFDRPQLGLRMALLSSRFEVLVDKHFDGKRELPIWRTISIYNDSVEKVPKLRVFYDFANSVPFPLPDRPLPNKIRFKQLQICYIDHSVITFLRTNQQIWDKSGSILRFCVLSHNNNNNVQPIWDVFVREILPIFAPNIRHLFFPNADHLNTWLRLISPSILTDLDQLNSIFSQWVFPDAINDFDGPNATDGQILSKWLHISRKDGQPKKLQCLDENQGQSNFNWITNLKEIFLRATTSVSYKIQFKTHNTLIVPFELVNERSNEKLTLTAKESKDKWGNRWIMKRCQIGETTAIQWEDQNWKDFNTVDFWLHNVIICLGPLSPTPTEEGEAGQSVEKVGQSVEKVGQSVEKGASSDK